MEVEFVITPLQRARGQFGLDVRADGSRTRMADLVQAGCCRLLFPRIVGQGMEAATVNISGGVAAGDRIEGHLACGEGTDLLVTSQAAERIYRARPDDAPAEIAVSCHVAANARLEWLPHGTIFFDGSRLHRHMTVDMAGSASFLFLENRIFGRRGSGEHLSRLGVRDRLSIRRDGELLLEDMLRLDSTDVSALLAQPAVMGGQGAVATLVLVSPQAMDLLPALRSRLTAPECAGFAASAWNGMLVARGLAPGGWPLEVAVRHILPVLRDARPMPSTWRS
ncbi:urease accessory protein UreD [Komagataeibacter intermedius]|uniref:Urease accessory protein UreD n=2 Tax=Komagataeibacter intermedius TaxID=66229 RepID=A0A0C1UW97_9PROT|nr:urease accessory protein UreD [Komagataeibacter intermedius]KPH86029.1 urease accessory protein UreD [Komagataeibacter intermedius AF2]KPH86397.1 urease accessory protein UreD [Komagataeibacter intermedius AF2]GAN86530.1 urease accessory protein UreD [Komagataeibacter intermedius TF2]GBQ76269.1 urease accessory protein UreH [Komagataeibacter intermedius NRIC 0521]